VKTRRDRGGKTGETPAAEHFEEEVQNRGKTVKKTEP